MNDQRMAALEARLKRVEAVLKAERERNRELVRAHLDLVEMLQKDREVTTKRMNFLVKDYHKLYQRLCDLYQEMNSGLETTPVE